VLATALKRRRAQQALANGVPQDKRFSFFFFQHFSFSS
jgi:hypothetical protein